MAEIKGIFRKKSIVNTIMRLCIPMTLFKIYMESPIFNDIVGYVAISVVLLFFINSLLFNRRAFFYVKDNHIKGKYAFFSKIDCAVSDVEFVLAHNNMLTIKLKSGKKCNISGIMNPVEICNYIRRNMPFVIAETPDVLIKELNDFIKQTKRNVVFMCIAAFGMLASIVAAVLLTGGKDINEYITSDWIIFIIMIVAATAFLIATFIFADRAGKMNTEIPALRYKVRRAIIEKAYPPSANILKIYTSDDYFGRIIICGYPNDNSVYYIMQRIVHDCYALETSAPSEIFEDMEHLPEGLDELIDITDKFSDMIFEINSSYDN